jgi:hypothetical protein
LRGHFRIIHRTPAIHSLVSEQSRGEVPFCGRNETGKMALAIRGCGKPNEIIVRNSIPAAALN